MNYLSLLQQLNDYIFYYYFKMFYNLIFYYNIYNLKSLAQNLYYI